jgi:signal transduction histidine kinase
MHQVFANLLDNAIKYALEGTRIYLEVKETKDSYLVRMTNTSSYEMDFTPDEIMQRFARGDKARSTKGSGLGLAIAQTYTESAGGSFRISPDGDQFSAIVELPKIERNL